MAKKRNATDATLRNINALKKRLAQLEARAKAKRVARKAAVK